MAKTAINIVRKVYPDVVDECGRLAAQNGRTMTGQAVWMLRHVMGLQKNINNDIPGRNPSSVKDATIASSNPSVKVKAKDSVGLAG